MQPDVLLNLLLLLHTVPVSTRGPRLVMLTRMPLSQVAPWSSPVCVCVVCVYVCTFECVREWVRMCTYVRERVYAYVFTCVCMRPCVFASAARV